MPYIRQECRADLDHVRLDNIGFKCNGVGELTYALYKIVHDRARLFGDSVRYADHADVIAALDNAKEEYRRQHLNPYEDAKRAENGDI